MSSTAWWCSWGYFVGPCVHGRDPFTRCDVCCADARLARALSEMAEALEKAGKGDEVQAILIRCGIPDDEYHETPPHGTDIVCPISVVKFTSR